MVAALAAGQGIAAQLGRKLRAGETAIFAAAATILTLAFAVVVLWGILAYVGLPFTQENALMLMVGQADPDLAAYLPLIIVIGGVVTFLVSFLFVGLGVSTQLKALERKAAKGR